MMPEDRVFRPFVDELPGYQYTVIRLSKKKTIGYSTDFLIDWITWINSKRKLHHYQLVDYLISSTNWNSIFTEENHIIFELDISINGYFNEF